MAKKKQVEVEQVEAPAVKLDENGALTFRSLTLLSRQQRQDQRQARREEHALYCLKTSPIIQRRLQERLSESHPDIFSMDDSTDGFLAKLLKFLADHQEEISAILKIVIALIA
jgi:hypothetical protein